MLTHVTHGARAGATLVSEDRRAHADRRGGAGRSPDRRGLARAAGQGDGKPDGKGKATGKAAKKLRAIHHVELTHPAPLLANRLTIVDTPGVNDINEQRAEITYGYLPRADAAVFLLDATQILTASERQFLEERILRSTRDRLIFVVAKADLLDDGRAGGDAALRAQAPGGDRARAGDLPGVGEARAGGRSRPGRGWTRSSSALGATVANERRRLLLDNALADATRLSAFIRQSLAIRRRSLELPRARAGGADRARPGAAALGEEGAGERRRDDRAPRPRR